MKKLFYFILLFVGSWQSYGQYSDLHYFPPLSQVNNLSGTISVRFHKFYITTAVTSPFTVTVYRGTSTTPFATLTISKTSPGFITSANGLSDETNNITLMDDSRIGIVQSNAGLRFESSGGQKFYVNYRVVGQSHGTSITSKGRAALGTAFKWGGVPNRGTTIAEQSSSMGIMATEDNTVVNIFGYNPACTFMQGNNSDAITADNLSFTLMKGETYVLKSMITTQDSPNRDGWIGASVTASKPIAMNVGQFAMAIAVHGRQDVGADQIIPENALGRDYIFVRGNGQDEYEVPIIVATQNDTKIYVNGSATAIATINNGDYYVIPGSNYSTSAPTSYIDDARPGSPSVPGGNMYVQTSKEVYAYQGIAGASAPQTVDLNFIAPVNCLLSSDIDFISNITELSTTTGMVGGITIIASTSIPDANIDVRHNNGTRISLGTMTAARRSVAGTSDWKTYYLSNLTGNVSVSSSGPIAVGFIMTSGLIGASGYFSGFENIPVVNVTVVGTGCLPTGASLVATPGFPSYAWYRNGVLIPGQTSNEYWPSLAGDYYVIVSNGSCDYQSASQTINDCTPDVVTSITADKNTVNSGETLTFTIKVGFFGFTNLTNLVVQNQIPANLNIVSATPSFGTWTGSGSNFNWTIGTMWPGEEHILTVVTTVKTISVNATQTYTLTNTQTEAESNEIPDDSIETILFLARPLPTLSNFPNYTKQFGEPNFNLTNPTSNSNGTFTFTSSDESVVRIVGSQVILVGQGNATVTATQAETASWASRSISAIITVLPKNALFRSGQLSTTSPIIVNRNGARGFGSGHNQYGEPIISLNTPTIYTKAISSITTTTASAGGVIVSEGGTLITARGVCWRRLAGATIEHNFTTDAGTTGEFNSSLTGLSPGTTYYLRAYSTNKMGTSYGDEITFTTSN